MGARKIIASTAIKKKNKYINTFFQKEIYLLPSLTIVKEGCPSRYYSADFLSINVFDFYYYRVSRTLTSLAPTPTYVYNPPLGTTIPARADLHFKFIFRDTDCLESRFEYIVISWRIPQRSNTLKVIQKAKKKTISSTFQNWQREV